MLEIFSKSLKHRLALPLPGREAQLKMAHAERRLNLSRYKIPQDARWGSVLILLYEDDGTIKFPLILRADYDGVHSGQIALPGGKYESPDLDLQATALRESQEEIGVRQSDVSIIGKLTELYIPPSNFLVHPYIGTIAYKPMFIPDTAEVARIIELDLDTLMDENNLGDKEIKLSSGLTIRTPVFHFQEETVWGATAMMLSEFKSVLFEMGI
ncbi:MAG TPA: CoA pyrophosphatase [Bacteroidia bacterium]|nr:CoA pyrophosphatase [Bacteroidia bacterium]HNP98552.1 CoA pyrophosphatase [Bacteroidia bacterium]